MSTIVLTESIDRPDDWPEEGKLHFQLRDTLLGIQDLACDTGYVVRGYDFAHPEVRASAFNNALDDGTFDLTKYLGSRAVTLELSLKVRATMNDTGPRIVMHDGVEATEPRLRDRVRAYLHPTRRPRLIFSEHDDPRVRQIFLRGSDSGVAFANPRYNAMSVSWVAPRSYIESYK